MYLPYKVFPKIIDCIILNIDNKRMIYELQKKTKVLKTNTIISEQYKLHTFIRILLNCMYIIKAENIEKNVS